MTVRSYFGISGKYVLLHGYNVNVDGEFTRSCAPPCCLFSVLEGVFVFAGKCWKLWEIFGIKFSVYVPRKQKFDYSIIRSLLGCTNSCQYRVMRNF